MELNFINNELRESRLFRSSHELSNKTAEDIKNISFLYFLTLSIMSEEFSTATFAQDYLIKTFKHGSKFERASRTDTDLYWCLHIIFENQYQILKSSHEEENKMELEKINLDKFKVLQWVRKTIKATTTQSDTSRFLTILENSLKINNSDYKDLRRLISRWSDLSNQQRTIVCTRLLFALNRYARMSEIYPEFSNFVKGKGYLWKDAKDPEIPDHSGLKQFAKDIGMGAITGLLVSFAAAKMNTEDLRQKYRKEWIKENTTSASIASIAIPLGTVIKRSDRKKKSTK